MTTPYIIILSDSDDENDNVPSTIFVSDSDNESNHSEPIEEEEHPASEYVPEDMENEEDPSEEDPSEDDPSEHEIETESEETVSETSVPSPPTYWTNHTSGPHTIHTARKRVAIPHRRVTSSPESSVPTTDPYFNPTVPAEEYEHYHAKNWTWLADTLQEWRKEEGFPTITEVGESSTAGQEYPYTKEPPHHTVPLIVARMSSQELRIEHAENNIMEMPGTETLEDLQYQISNLEQHVGEVRDATEDLKQKSKESAGKTVSLERRMDQLEQSLEKLQVMAATMGDYAAFILRGDHIPKKD